MPSMIYVFVGPPCSGKSTEAKLRLKDNDKLVRLNRDSFRYMLRNEGMCSGDIEKTITSYSDMMLDRFIAHGYDVIIDNTNCNLGRLKEFVKKYEEKADILVEVFKEPKWLLKWRNIKRYITDGIWIPTKVIDSMYTRQQEIIAYLNTNKHDFSK